MTSGPSPRNVSLQGPGRGSQGIQAWSPWDCRKVGKGVRMRKLGFAEPECVRNTEFVPRSDTGNLRLGTVAKSCFQRVREVFRLKPNASRDSEDSCGF